MASREIVVIGGSAGSIQVLNAILGSLPADFPAPIFVVVHISPDAPMTLAPLLSRIGPLPATNPLDGEQIRGGHIYVARPDHQLTIEDGKIRMLRGPRENRHRPAIDPLFRTAARAYGPGVVGVVLSGLQDDGSAGLYTIKQRGGLAIVQDPDDALWKDMPRHAIEYVGPDYVLPAIGIAAVLVQSVQETKSEAAMPKKKSSRTNSNGKSRLGKIAGTDETLGQPDANKEVAYSDEGEGMPSVFACPECHGVLWELKDGKMVRFRCRTGHSYSMETLKQEISTASEAALWAAVRALEEKSAMQRRVVDTMSLDGSMSSRLLDQSAVDGENALLIRDMIFRRDAALDGEKSEKKAASKETRKEAATKARKKA